MTKIKFKDGSELQVVVVNGMQTFTQNANREAIEVVFDASEHQIEEIAE